MPDRSHQCGRQKAPGFMVLLDMMLRYNAIMRTKEASLINSNNGNRCGKNQTATLPWHQDVTETEKPELTTASRNERYMSLMKSEKSQNKSLIYLTSTQHTLNLIFNTLTEKKNIDSCLNVSKSDTIKLICQRQSNDISVQCFSACFGGKIYLYNLAINPIL